VALQDSTSFISRKSKSDHLQSVFGIYASLVPHNTIHALLVLLFVLLFGHIAYVA